MSLKNKALKAARLFGGNAVSPEHHAKLAGTIEREAQALSISHGRHFTPAHISDRFTKDELRVLPENVIPWARLQVDGTVLLLGLTHANKDMTDPSAQDVMFDFKGADTPHAVILAYYQDGSFFPSDEDVMIAATDATPSTLMEEEGMTSMMKGGLLDHLMRLLVKYGRIAQ